MHGDHQIEKGDFEWPSGLILEGTIFRSQIFAEGANLEN